LHLGDELAVLLRPVAFNLRITYPNGRYKSVSKVWIRCFSIKYFFYIYSAIYSILRCIITVNIMDKLLELTKRAISVNKDLLAEEEKFAEALSEHRDIKDLKEKSDKISLLIRKEVLYQQVTTKVLEKTVNQ
jgi:hypothetical protein